MENGVSEVIKIFGFPNRCRTYLQFKAHRELFISNPAPSVERKLGEV